MTITRSGRRKILACKTPAGGFSRKRQAQRMAPMRQQGRSTTPSPTNQQWSSWPARAIALSTAALLLLTSVASGVWAQSGRDVEAESEPAPASRAALEPQPTEAQL